MTEFQIQKYEYCKKHLAELNGYIENLPFKIQKYGCGQSMPNIEHDLETVHRIMYNEVIAAIEKARAEVQKKIDDI